MPAILFELNEVPFKVLDAYVARTPGGVLARLISKSAQFEAICEDKVELDP
jgi:hypothetical protein